MPKLNAPQARFVALDKKFKALVAGFGTGKTWAGCADLCRHAYEWPGVNAGYFAPTYPMIRDIFFPTIEEVAADWGLDVQINESNKEVHFYSSGQYRTTVICRSMEKPGSIVGFKIGKALVDELDVMTRVKAEQAWRKIIARLRHQADGLQNGVSVTTTPEGFKFVYDQFFKAVRDKPELQALYGLVHASTWENAKNLPVGYIESLIASYPPQLIKAYLDGLFVNLTAGAVYPDFDRIKNHTPETIHEGEELHVGMDFNVYNCSAAIGVIRNDRPLVLDELKKVRDTPAMVKELRDRHPRHRIHVYPDASGQSNKTVNASLSDLQILQDGGFQLHVDGTNPLVKDRVNSVNASILNGKGERTLLVNTQRCPVLTECLEQQVYDDNGVPDKTAGNDHLNDAIGYFITKRWPVLRPVITRTAQIHHSAR
jgi:hypothetical protein